MLPTYPEAIQCIHMRVCVTRCDEQYIYGMASDAPDELTIAHTHLYDNANEQYLPHLLTEGSQLNLIEAQQKEGIWYPRLIIFEPDYLIDVSAIAACCESYSHSHLTYLLNKLKPSASTEAILLGHFAGQLLDEEVHGMYDRDYRDSVLDFFRGHSISLLTAELSSDFHNNARLQKQHIHQAINTVLPQEVSSFNSSDIILEPSFFSEILGIQGRMDFLQTDCSVLIEQKAGRCGWPQRHPDIPTEQAKHYMQMVLYEAVIRYNYREQYLCNGGHTRTFLLYSKYPQSLLELDTSESLLREAMKIRNHIVWAEYTYAYGGIGILEHLDAEELNEQNISSTLWSRYQKPQIEQLLQPLKSAAPQERAYWHRFMTFIANEHLHAKIGSATHGDYGFAEKWHDTLQEKYQKGNICDHLQLLSPQTEHIGKVSSVTLAFSEDHDIHMCNFRTGDIVILYPYPKDNVPDVRQGIVFRCTITELTASTLTLILRSPQSDAHVFLRDIDKDWAIEHDLMDSSFASQYRAVHAFLSMPQERRDLLLLRREPKVDTGLRLIGDYGEFNELALRARQSRELFLIIGPPGTGKTSFGLMSVLREELLADPSSSILLLSYTNRAVDEICNKLVDANLDFIRLGNPHNCPAEYHPYLLDTKVSNSLSLGEVRKHIEKSRIIVCTTTAINSHINLFALKQFTLAIIDEASQLLEPHLIGIMAAMHGNTPAVSRFVLIGDHKQLPAVVKQPSEESRIDESLLHDAMLTDCRQSLFERMLKRYRTHTAITYMLCRQGRMHHDIAQFPNIEFYGGMLTEATSAQTEAIDAPTTSPHLFAHRVTFIAQVPSEVDAHNCPERGKTNLPEAATIAAITHRVFKRYETHFSPNHTIGIIVPYRNQIAAVRRAIEKYSEEMLRDITIDTVERFQGSQRDVIIYGFTVDDQAGLDFLTENVFIDNGLTIDRKLNVVMTRARQHLFMVGNPQLLATNPLFRRLIQFTRDKGGYMDSSISF